MAYDEDESRDSDGDDTPMDELELCALIDHERQNGIGVDDQLSSDRTRAMAYYMGDARYELSPPDIDGRSRVVSKDLMEVIEQMMPSLMRMFCGADDVIRFEPEGPEDEQHASDATEYCAYLLYRKNEGFTVLHDAIKSALITRMGVVKVYCDEAWDEREEHYEGCAQPEVDALKADDNVEVVEVEEVIQADMPVVNGQPGQPQMQEPSFNVTVKRKERKRNIVVEGVPPEEIWFSKDNRDIGKLRCVGQDTERTISELLSLGYDEDKVYALPIGESADVYGEKYSRERYDGSFTHPDDDTADESQRIVTLQEAYIRCDYDGDGIAEYRRVVKCGTTIFENEVTDDHPFAIISPILMPYKLVGLSEWDMTEDTQRIKTAVVRQYLDNLYLANNPRKGVVEGMVNLDDLLNPRPGGVVRMKDPNGLVDINTMDIGAQAQAAINYFDSVRDRRTGIKEFSQGLVGDELSKSNIGSEGVGKLLDASDDRLELVARVIAETGIKRIYSLLLKEATQYQDRQTQIRVNGQWMQIDPRAWKNKYDMSVSIGIGTASKQRQMQYAMQLLTVQKEASQYGLVQPQNAYSSLEDLTSAMGKKDTSRYFTAPQQGVPPPQQPDPNAAAMAKVQADSQARMAELQQQGQLQQAKQQGDVEVERMKQQAQAAQSQAETQLEAQRNQMQMQNDKELAQFKANLEMSAALQKAQLQVESAERIEAMKLASAERIAYINASAKVEAAAAMGAKDDSTVPAYVERAESMEGSA